MYANIRSYLAFGVVAAGAAAITLSPVHPLPDQMALAHDRVVSNLAVNLASTIDPITPWVNAFQTTAANIKGLGELYAQKPFPLLQTIGANIGTYFGELTSGNGNLIPGQIQNNIKTFFYAPWDPGTCAAGCDEGEVAFYDGDYISNVPITNRTLLGKLSQREVYQSLPLALSSDPDLLTALAPVLAFAATH